MNKRQQGQSQETAAAKGGISERSSQLQANTDSPNLFEFQRGFLTDQFAFIPRRVVISVSSDNLIHDELLR